MGTISVRLSDEEECDLTLFDNVWQDEKGCEIISHEEMKSELGLM